MVLAAVCLTSGSTTARCIMLESKKRPQAGRRRSAWLTLCSVLVVAHLAGVTAVTTRRLQQQNCTAAQKVAAVNSGVVPFRGVNLGSWLVMEKWMLDDVRHPTPLWPESVRDGEYQLMMSPQASPDARTARNALNLEVTAFRDGWVTLTDFQIMAAVGINAVRLPVGHWVMATDVSEAWPYLQGAYSYVDSTMDWGLQTGISVMIDLHAFWQGSEQSSSPIVPGQEDFDNATSQPSSGPSYPQQTLDTLQAIVTRYSAVDDAGTPKYPAFAGLFLLNEPEASTESVMDYYTQAYDVVRNLSADCWIVIAPQTWEQLPGSEWDSFMVDYPYKGDHKLLRDLHMYQLPWAGPVYSNFTNSSQNVEYVNTVWQGLMNNLTTNGGLRPVVGEWTLAGPNFDFQQDAASDIQEFWKAQWAVWETPGCAGSFFWSVKNTVGADVWSFMAALFRGWIDTAPMLNAQQC